MTRSRILGVPLVTVGVVIIIIGTLVILVGVDEQRLAEEWAQQKQYQCENAVIQTLPNDASPEEVSLTLHEKRSGSYRTSPYHFGGIKVVIRVVPALLGGAIAYHGTR
ncbi:hypothetical protein [Halomarina pelagica]|uniref:hypothetical protein n=1 Tax=Halomarina pelagica TaxID=2961599 RepID=UPI0020C578F5|nr:hypothetical protein [Halomarina sp. BND7]